MTAKPKTEPTATKTEPAPKPAPTGIGVKELAAHLGIEPKRLRMFLRKTERAAGKGSRYSWPSLKSAEVRKIEADWNAAHKDAQEDGES